MSAFDFQSLGLDRLSQNIKRAVTTPTGTITTGDLTKGTSVVVEFDNEATATANVAERRTGAILLGMTIEVSNADYKWSISDTTLTVVASGAITGSFTFWVF